MHLTRIRIRRAERPGFTRIELACILGVLALLVLVLAPALASTTRTDRVICANNLRQIGLAIHLWGHDYGDRTPFAVAADEGGTRSHVLAPNVWVHFARMSNELATPQWLLCPSDSGRAARDFSNDPDGGYLHPNFANRATSYFLSHSFAYGPGAVIAGDRNVGSEAAVGCSVFVTAASVAIRPVPSTVFRWTNGLHGTSGNVLHQDGSVEQLSSLGLARSVTSAEVDNGSFHFITPR